jgi:hypothetical protein
MLNGAQDPFGDAQFEQDQKLDTENTLRGFRLLREVEEDLEAKEDLVNQNKMVSDAMKKKVLITQKAEEEQKNQMLHQVMKQ